MTSTELDLPLLPSAEQIRRREFATIRRGYDPEQVREYLRSVAEQVETLEHELRDARLEAETPVRSTEAVVVPEPESDELESEPESEPKTAETEPEPDRYELLGERVAELLRAADEQATQLLDESHAESSRMLEEARADADRIRLDAQARAEEARTQGSEFLSHARAEADKVLAGLSSRRETLVDQLQQMQSRLLGVAKELGSAIGSGPEPATSSAPPDPVDPRYDDLWISTDRDIAPLADLPPLDLDFGEDLPDAD